MSKTAVDWRQAKQESARLALVEAAWSAVQDEGLAGLSLRDLARRAGTTTPTIYNYFASKYDIYDAMFEQAATEFESHMAAPYVADDPRGALVEGLRRFVQFCVDDTVRYQLLFQRTIPEFEPSAEAYSPALRALEGARAQLARCGIKSQRHVDMWTALTTGLVSQQIANDPDGNRWSRLIDDAVSMFLSHCKQTSTRRKPNK